MQDQVKRELYAPLEDSQRKLDMEPPSAIGVFIRHVNIYNNVISEMCSHHIHKSMLLTAFSTTVRVESFKPNQVKEEFHTPQEHAQGKLIITTITFVFIVYTKVNAAAAFCIMYTIFSPPYNHTCTHTQKHSCRNK